MAFGRDVFLTGRYMQYFKPDDERNPFNKIYDRKKHDIIDLINESEKSKIILDVGGGMGRLSLALANSAKNKVVLADISIGMLRLVADHAGGMNNLRIIKADAHELPFLDSTFDYVVGLDLFCHLQRPESALSEFHRVLRNQGLLILDSTNSNPLWALFYPRYMGKNPLTWLRIFKSRGVYPGWECIVKHYPKKRFFSFLQEAGFKVIRSLNYGPVVCPKWHLAVSIKLI